MGGMPVSAAVARSCKASEMSLSVATGIGALQQAPLNPSKNEGLSSVHCWNGDSCEGSSGG